MDPSAKVALATGVIGGLIVFGLTLYGSHGKRPAAAAALGAALGVLLYLVATGWLGQ
jgi:hypothetical protein